MGREKQDWPSGVLGDDLCQHAEPAALGVGLKNCRELREGVWGMMGTRPQTHTGVRSWGANEVVLGIWVWP